MPSLCASATSSTPSMKPQRLPPQCESPGDGFASRWKAGSGSYRNNLPRAPSRLRLSAVLRQSSLFWEIPSFWELDRLLLNVCATAQAGNTRLPSAGRHGTWEAPLQPPDRDVPGEVMEFPSPGSSSSQPQGYTQMMPKPKAMQEELPSSMPPSLGRSYSFLFCLQHHFLPCSMGCRWL